MKTKTLAVALVATTAMAIPAYAQDSGAYGTLGVKTIEFDSYSLEGRLGYNLNDFLSIEGEGAVGIIGEDSAGLEIDEDFSLGGYLRAGLPISEQFKIFGRIGYQYSDFSVDGPGVNVSEGFEGLAYGGGIEFYLTDRTGLRFDYTAVDYGTESGVDVGTADTVSASFVVKF